MVAHGSFSATEIRSSSPPGKGGPEVLQSTDECRVREGRGQLAGDLLDERQEARRECLLGVLYYVVQDVDCTGVLALTRCGALRPSSSRARPG